jgi:hypothetical protein
MRFMIKFYLSASKMNGSVNMFDTFLVQQHGSRMMTPIWRLRPAAAAAQPGASDPSL